ncbi:MAG TPA: hypothetical protein DDY37_00140, partial [Legionella sp.]|nr:hypothetical protein [Legionella sp.]
YFPCDKFQEPYAYHLMAPCDRSAKDFRNKELNLLFPREYVTLFENDPIRILRIIQALSRSDFTISKDLEYDIKQYIKTHEKYVFKNINPDRFYHNLKSLFYSGHAVKNLEKLLQFQLFDELFPFVQKLSKELKALTLYLVNRVAMDSDSDFLLSPSLFFYAVYWNDIKQKSYSPYSISDLSCGMVNIPVASFSKTKRSNERDVLNETIHRENIAYLSLWEKKYNTQFESERMLEGNLIMIERNLMQMMEDKIKKSWDKPSVLFLKSRQNALSTIVEENEDICRLEIDTNSLESVISHQCSANDYAIHCQRATISLHIGKYKESRDNFKRAITLNPSLPDAYCGLGQVAKRQAENYNASIRSVLSRMNLLKNNLKISKKSIGKCKKEHQLYVQQQNDQYLRAVAYCEQSLARSAHYPPATQLLRTIGDAVKHHVEAMHATLEKTENLFPFVLPLQRLATPMIADNPIMNRDGDQPNDKHKQMIQDALREEGFEHYQKALDIYHQLSVGNHALMARHQCVRLHVQLNQYNKALKCANRLVDISEEDYNNRYGRHKTRQAAPFDNYQYHHYYAILQRGETHLKSGQLGEAIKNFDCIIKRYVHSQDDPDNTLVEITMKSYIYKGKAIHQLARAECEIIMMKDSPQQTEVMEMNTLDIQQEHSKKFDVAMLEVMEKEIHAQQYYENAKILINKLGHDFTNDLMMVYFGLGEIEQLKGHVDGPQSAKEYYEIGLSLIHEKILNSQYANDISIHNDLFRSAEYISGFFIKKTNEQLLHKKSFIVREMDILFMEYSKEIYLKSLLYVPKNEFRMANIQLIKISLILSKYDDAILQIESILSGHLKGSSCCRRELFLLLGECYERKKMHRIAIEYYKKVQALIYDDDNSQRQELMNLAQNAMNRILIMNQFLMIPIDFSEKNTLGSIASRSELNISLPDVDAYIARIKMEQFQGNIDAAEKYFIEYLQLLNASLKETSDLPKERIYDCFFSIAESISGDALTRVMNDLLIMDTFSSMALNESDHILLKQSKDAYQQALEHMPACLFHRAYDRLSVIAFILGDYDEVIQGIEGMLRRKASTLSYSKSDLFELLRKCYEKLGRDFKADEMWFQVGSGEHASGEYHHAIDSYTRAIELNPHHLQCYFARIESFIGLQQYDNALRDSEFLVSIGMDEYNQHYKVSQKAPYDQYKYHFLSARFQRGYVHLVRAQHLLVLDDTSALLDFDYTIKECSTLKTREFRTLASYAFNGRGLCYEARAQVFRAQLRGHQSIQIIGQIERADNDAMRVINDFEAEAISAYQQVIAHSPSPDKQTIEKSSLAESYRGLGNIAKAKGELAFAKSGLNKKEFKVGLRHIDRAEQYYLTAIRIDPNMGTSLLGLGHIEDMRSQFGFMTPEDIRKHQDVARKYYLNSLQHRPYCHEAYLRLGRIAQVQGDANEASSHYRQYFLFIRAQLEMNAGSISPEDSCLIYNQLADKIVSGKKIVSTVKQLFFSVEQSPTVSDFDLNFFGLLHCIYSEAAGCLSSMNNTQIKLISISIILRHFDDAIERIQELLQAHFTMLELSKRELFYLCAKMHDMKNNHVEAKRNYLQAVSLKSYDDDNERSSHIVSYAKTGLKKIIEADVARALTPSSPVAKKTTGIAQLNMFAEQATSSLMENVQCPSDAHGLTRRL